jgi:hypothetical protein
VFFEKYSFNTQPINCSIGAGSWVIGFKCHFQQYFGYIVSVSFIGGGNRSTMRKPLTCCKSLTNFITCLPLLESHGKAGGGLYMMCHKTLLNI